MIIGIASLGLSSVLALGGLCCLFNLSVSLPYRGIPRVVIRQMLVADNKRLEREEQKEMTPAKRLRIEEAARLEGLTFEEALERNKGFRYLY